MPTITIAESRLDRLPRIRDTVVGAQVDLLEFDRAPEPLDEHVVLPREQQTVAD